MTETCPFCHSPARIGPLNVYDVTLNPGICVEADASCTNNLCGGYRRASDGVWVWVGFGKEAPECHNSEAD